jgi:hypothetical protein
MRQQPGIPPASSWQPMPSPAAAKPAKKRHKWPWVIAGIVVLILIVAAMTGQRDPAQTTQPAGVAPTTAPAAQAQQTTTVQPTTTTTTLPPAPPRVKSGRGDDVVSIDRAGVKDRHVRLPALHEQHRSHNRRGGVVAGQHHRQIPRPALGRYPGRFGHVHLHDQGDRCLDSHRGRPRHGTHHPRRTGHRYRRRRCLPQA